VLLIFFKVRVGERGGIRQPLSVRIFRQYLKAFYVYFMSVAANR
jgi:hypothetical protein